MDRKLDLTYSNVEDVNAKVLPPLETEQGIASDHGCVFQVFKVPKKKRFVWKKKKVRIRTAAGDKRFR